jgi:hypothetical protein
MQNQIQDLIVKFIDTLKANGFYGGFKIGSPIIDGIVRAAEEAGRPAPVNQIIGIRRSPVGLMLSGVQLHRPDGREAPPLAWAPDSDTPETAAGKLHTTIQVLSQWLDAASQNEASTPSRVLPNLPHNSTTELLTATDWGQRYGINREAARKRFSRWAEKNPQHSGILPTPKGGRIRASYVFTKEAADLALRPVSMSTSCPIQKK